MDMSICYVYGKVTRLKSIKTPIALLITMVIGEHCQKQRKIWQFGKKSSLILIEATFSDPRITFVDTLYPLGIAGNKEMASQTPLEVNYPVPVMLSCTKRLSTRDDQPRCLEC